MNDSDQSFDRRRSGPGEGYFINDKLRILQSSLIEMEESKFSGRNRQFNQRFERGGAGRAVQAVHQRDHHEQGEELQLRPRARRLLIQCREGQARTGGHHAQETNTALNATAIRVRNLTPWVSNEFDSFPHNNVHPPADWGGPPADRQSSAFHPLSSCRQADLQHVGG